MTLSVHAFSVHPETEEWEDIPQDTGQGGQGNRSLAGFESCRTTLWVSKIVRSLGCRLLPSLATEDLYATGADLVLLAAECRQILEHLAEVAVYARYTEEYIAFRTGNILEAIRMAEAVERGTVVIW
jgi:hypothetical protein